MQPNRTALAHARQTERAREWAQPRVPQRKDGAIVVADGYGINIRVSHGRLHVGDGVGRDRRERNYPRTMRLSRLIVLGGSGALSLEAIRWLDRVGAALACIDRDGKLLLTSGPTRPEAKLRRAQALARFNDSGIEVARALLRAKVEGQRELLDRLDADPHARRVLERSLAAIETSVNVDDLLATEAEAAATYWGSWAGVEVRFAPADQLRIAAHWRTFGQRHSTLTSGPRMATNPAGAILNYLYALLEAECRLACQIVGLDPALAIVHADIRGRDSFPLDLMEAVRPNVDRYLLALLRDRIFQASNFHETQRGSVRLLAPLTHELAETMPAWRRLVAPVAEQVASTLVKTEPGLVRQPTPLTEANRRADRARRHRASDTAKPTVLRPEPRCKRCGGKLPHRDRVYCDECLPHYRREQYSAYAEAGVAGLAMLRKAGVDPSHGGAAAHRRGETQARRQRERREWDEANSSSSDSERFQRKILPLIQGVPLSELVTATGLSLPYVSQIRRGEKIPHPRHWAALVAQASAERG
jgi:CRISPR-associated endonuclease Cas1